MKRITQGRMLVLMGPLAFLVLIGTACSDAAGTPKAATSQPTIAPGGGASQGVIVPNTFLTFAGKRYRLVGLEQANLIDGNQFQKIGTTSDADINQTDLTVYSRSSDAGAIYTYTPVRSGPTEVVAVEGESGNTPALWYRWVLER